MKAEAEPIKITTLPAAGLKAVDYLELTKPKISAMVLVAALTGFYMAHRGPMDLWLLFNTLLGTALVGGGASGLNQVLEREFDARMLRTRNRPVPSGRLSAAESLWFSAGLAAFGLVHLLLTTNALAALVAAASLVLYVWVYTPLKRLTPANTIVGALPGALPPMIGWAAASGRLPPVAWTLFLILFLWQIPHFMAIAWMYRKDYERGGFMMLPVVDPEGKRTAHQILGQGLALSAASLLPSLWGMTGGYYLYAALILSSIFFLFGVATALKRTTSAARWLLLASVIYLPLLLGSMMLDKIC